MKLLSLVFLVFGILSVKAEIETDENVLVLTDENFDEALKDNKFILVEFYAPWCGHCKALAPEYAKAAGALLAEESEIKLAKLDATVHKKAAEKFEVRGYPTLKFFKSGEAKEYGGGRQSADIVNWLKKKTGPPTTPLSGEEAFNKAKEANEVAVVGYFADPSSEEGAAFTKVADSFDDVPFYVVSDAATAKVAGLELGKVAVFKKFDEGRADFEGALADDLAKFVKGNQIALLSEFTSESAPKIFGGDIQNHALLFLSKKSEEFKTQTDNFRTAAKEFKGKMLFIYIDSDVEENKRVMEFFGLSGDDVPTYRVIKMAENMAKFKPEEQDLSAEAVTKFAQGVLSGEVARHLMSEPVPEDWNKGPVAVLVGKNFKEVAFDSTKKVFVEFYAPWCEHSHQLAHTWLRLANKFKANPDVVIAKIDATKNDIPGFKFIGAYPTMLFFPKFDPLKGGDKVVDYSGDREVEAMEKFVKSNGADVSEPVDEEFDEEDIEEDGDDELPDEEALNKKDEL